MRNSRFSFTAAIPGDLVPSGRDSRIHGKAAARPVVRTRFSRLGPRLTGSARLCGVGEYREVVAPERLSFTVTDQPGNDERDLVTVVLTDLGDGRTEMLMTQTAAFSRPRATRPPPRAGAGFSTGWPSA